MISNRDIGFVEVGQDAAIKVDRFNFTRYGLLHGKVLTVSHDAITRDKPQERMIDKPQGAEEVARFLDAAAEKVAPHAVKLRIAIGLKRLQRFVGAATGLL